MPHDILGYPRSARPDLMGTTDGRMPKQTPNGSAIATFVNFRMLHPQEVIFRRAFRIIPAVIRDSRNVTVNWCELPRAFVCEFRNECVFEIFARPEPWTWENPQNVWIKQKHNRWCFVLCRFEVLPFSFLRVAHFHEFSMQYGLVISQALFSIWWFSE